jgi:hypothetical protein
VSRATIATQSCRHDGSYSDVSLPDQTERPGPGTLKNAKISGGVPSVQRLSSMSQARASPVIISFLWNVEGLSNPDMPKEPFNVRLYWFYHPM